MPGSEEILAHLTGIAEQWLILAVFWHAYYAALLLFLSKRQTSARLAGILTTIPLLSVSALAWVHNNPFNGIFFAIVGIVLIVLAGRSPGQKIERAPKWMIVTGALLFLLGWVYPHFLSRYPVWIYLYAAPIGLIPCPTLSASIGLALIWKGFLSRTWMWTLGATGLFYGIFGCARLGVRIDVLLALGAMVLIAAGWRFRKIPIR